MDHPCSDGGPESNRIRCTKFVEACTTFSERCTKGFQSTFRGGDRPLITFLWVPKWNYGPKWYDGGSKSNRMGCTKFYKGCTKFCVGCTKGSKVCSDVGIDPQSLPYGFPNEIMNFRWYDGGFGSKWMGCIKFYKGCTKFCEGCTKGSKVCSEIGIGP